jgi:hypothetical protein
MAPIITGVSGTLSHGSTLIISGSGFGAKSPAAPLVWDDCQGTNPLALWDEVRGGDAAKGNAMGYRSPSQVEYQAGFVGGEALPHSFISKYLCGGAYLTAPDNTSYNFTVSKNNWQNYYPYMFLHYKERISGVYYPKPGGDHNFKVCQLGVGNGYFGGDVSNTYWNFFGIDQTDINWGVNYIEGMQVTIRSVNTGIGMTWYPQFDTVFCSTIPNANPRLRWNQFDWVSLNNDPVNGVNRIRQNGVLVFEAFLDTDGYVGASDPLRHWTIGGLWNDYGTTVEFKDNWRFFADLYLDNTWARVIIGDSNVYANCTKLEPQIPSAWSANSISVTCKQNALSSLLTSFLYVVDSAGNVSNAFDLSGGTPPPPDPAVGSYQGVSVGMPRGFARRRR